MREHFFHHGPRYIYLLTGDKELFINLSLVVITFLAVLVALFGDWFRSLIFRPKLKFKTAPPIPQLFEGEKYTMYRMLVINTGYAAQEVRALITNITQPLYLRWTNIDEITRDISKNEPAYLDIIQEKNGKYYYYPWANIIDLKKDELSNSKPTEIKIEFFERDHHLPSAKLRFDPSTKTLKVLQPFPRWNSRL